MNLRTIPHLGQAFNVPVGLSDHTLEVAVPVAAVAMGACIIEKHFTLDRSEGGPDSAFSLEPAEFRKMVDAKVQAIASPFVLIPTPAMEAVSRYKAPYVHGNTQQASLDLVKANPAKYGHIFQIDPPETFYGAGFPAFLEQLQASGGWKPINNKVHIIREHVQHAIECGGRVIVGGDKAVGERVVHPIVLADVPESCPAVTDESFGPVVIVNRMRDLNDGVDTANASQYGLGASLFGSDRTALAAAARRLRTGMVSINSWVMYAGVPALPWGGVGNSGFGRIHGPDGLHEFARSKGVVRERFTSPLVLTSFSRRPDTGALVSKALVALHGRRTWRS
jgi:hypothetical protein